MTAGGVISNTKRALNARILILRCYIAFLYGMVAKNTYPQLRTQI